MSHGYIASLEKATSADERGISPTVDSLQKLAKGLQIPYEILDRLARGLSPEAPKISLPDDEVLQRLIDVAICLSSENRKEVLDFARWKMSQKENDSSI